MKERVLGHNVLLQGSVFSVPANISDKELRDYCNDWVVPYLSLVYKYPKIPFFFYMSGKILEYFENGGRAYNDVLHELIDRNQVEFIGGMYYDAAPVIQAKKDQRDQLEKMQNFVYKKYGVRVSGVWMTPGTFDNSIVQTIRQGGVKYMLADKAYLEPVPQDNSIALLEQQGNILLVLPYKENFLEFFSNEQKIQTFFRSFTAQPKTPAIFTFFSRYHTVHDFEKFFKVLETVLKNIAKRELYDQCSFPSKIMTGRKIIPKTLSRVRNSPWGDEESDTLFKYIVSRPESRLLYGRLQYIMKLVDSLKKKKKKDYESMRLGVWQEQNHFSYWRANEMWGIHHSLLRQNAYKTLNALEKNIRNSLKNETQSFHLTDMNLDHVEEQYLRTPSLNVLIEPCWGSVCILERNSNLKRWNYLSTFIPHPVVKFPPWSFRDYFFEDSKDRETGVDAEAKTIETFHKSMLNNSFKSNPVEYNSYKVEEKQMNVKYFGTASVVRSRQQPALTQLEVEKQYHVRGNTILLSFVYKNNTEEAISTLHTKEVNFSFHSDDISSLEIQHGEKGIDPIDPSVFSSFESDNFLILHKHKAEQLVFDFSHKAKISVAPVHEMRTPVKKHMTYQYTSFLFAQQVHVAAGQEVEQTIQLSFSSIAR